MQFKNIMKGIFLSLSLLQGFAKGEYYCSKYSSKSYKSFSVDCVNEHLDIRENIEITLKDNANLKELKNILSSDKLQYVVIEYEGNNQLSINESILGSLKSLQELKLEHIKINQKIINDIATLPKNVILDLYNCEFENNIDASSVKSVQTINLDEMEGNTNTLKGLSTFKAVPNVIFQEMNFKKDIDFSPLKNMDKLTSLEFEFLSSFEKGINFSPFKDFKSLTTLTVSLENTVPIDLIKVLQNSKSLNSLSISRINQNIINEVASRLVNLKELNLGGNIDDKKLDVTPLKSLKKLTSLGLTGLGLKSYPDFIFSLSNLKSLNLGGNELKTISEKLAKLKNLEKLMLGANNINTEIPEALNSLSKLKYIDFGSNPEIKGKTLTNSSLEYCEYYSKGYEAEDYESYLCKAKEMSCFEKANKEIRAYCYQCVHCDFHCYGDKVLNEDLKLCSNSGSPSSSDDIKTSTNGKCGKENGKCPSGECCSKYGYCGTSSKHCGTGCQSEFGKCDSPSSSDDIKTSTNGKCGKENGKCPSGECCSKYGYCGTSSKHCGTGCQSEFGKCDSSSSSDDIKTSTNGKCGKENGKCPSGKCCSKYGYCGTSSKHCGTGCQSEFGKCNSPSSSDDNIKTSTNGKCGKDNGKCPSGQCCSKYGYCGTSSKHCGTGCQSKFGKCN